VTIRRLPTPILLIPLLALATAPACSARRGAAAEPGAGFRLESAWDSPVAQSGEIHVASAPGGFLAAAASGTLTFFDAGTGKAAWSKESGAEIAGSLVVGAPGGHSDGEGAGPGWAAAMTRGGDIVVYPLASDGSAEIRPLGWPGAMLSAWGDGLIALDPAGAVAFIRPSDPASRWEIRMPPLAPVPASACGEIALLGTRDGRLVAVRPRDGSVAWRKSLGSPLAAAASCDRKHAFAATADNELHALRLHKRSAGRMWRIRSGADPAAAPVLRDGLVALLSEDTYLYGFNRRNGHLRFRIRLGRRPGTPAILHDILFVAGSHVAKLDAFRLPSGLAAGAFTLPVGGHFVTQPVVSGDHLAIGVGRYGEGSSTLVGLSRAVAPPPSTVTKSAD